MAEADPHNAPEAAAPAQSPAAEPAKPRRSLARLALMLVVPLAVIGSGVYYWQSQQGKVSTDNAYLKQEMVAISAEVGGQIVEVLVHEGDSVRAGQALFRIDTEPFELQMSQAEAAIATAQANVTTLSNDSDLTGVDIAAAREDIAFAQSRLHYHFLSL